MAYLPGQGSAAGRIWVNSVLVLVSKSDAIPDIDRPTFQTIPDANPVLDPDSIRNVRPIQSV